MINPVKGSELAEQIELARQSMERWPGWLKDAVGVSGKESVASSSGSQQSERGTQPSTADLID